MIKKLKISEKMKLLVAGLGIGLSLSACSGSTNIESENIPKQFDVNLEYNTDDLFFIFKDGVLYLAQIYQDGVYMNKYHFYDIYDRTYLGEFDMSADFKKNYSYSDNSNNCAYQFFLMSTIDNDDFVRGDTLNKIGKNMAYMEQYIDQHVGFDVVDSVSCDNVEYKNYLKIYCFYNELEDIRNYYIGYNASRIGSSEYIYDICDKKVYKFPDIGYVEYINVIDIYDKSFITINQAKEMLNEYKMLNEYILGIESKDDTKIKSLELN